MYFVLMKLKFRHLRHQLNQLNNFFYKKPEKKGILTYQKSGSISDSIDSERENKDSLNLYLKKIRLDLYENTSNNK